jgi:predicted NBD/HSP70 family sugar kinase
VRDILEQWADEVMVGLSTLIHIFNPSKVILGGGIMTQPLVMELIQERVPKYIMPNFRKVQIMTAALGNTAGLMGANHLAARLITANC